MLKRDSFYEEGEAEHIEINNNMQAAEDAQLKIPTPVGETKVVPKAKILDNIERDIIAKSQARASRSSGVSVGSPTNANPNPNPNPNPDTNTTNTEISTPSRLSIKKPKKDSKTAAEIRALAISALDQSISTKPSSKKRQIPVVTTSKNSSPNASTVSTADNTSPSFSDNENVNSSSSSSSPPLNETTTNGNEHEHQESSHSSNEQNDNIIDINNLSTQQAAPDSRAEDQQPLVETEWLPGDDWEYDDNNDGTNISVIGADGQNGDPSSEVDANTALLAFTVDPVIEGEILEEDDDPAVERKRLIRNVSICLVCFIIIAISVAVPLTMKFYKRETEMPSMVPSMMPSMIPSMVPTTNLFQDYIDALQDITPYHVFQNRTTPQYRALYWLYFDSNVKLADYNFVQLYALAVFYYSTGGDTWLACYEGDLVCKDQKLAYLTVDTNECDWYGNRCNADKLITSLNFGTSLGNNLTGTMPTEISALATLESLFIVNNLLEGTIPTTIGDIANLTQLFLYNNKLESPLPPSLFTLPKLKVLSIMLNFFSEPMPSEFALLPNMQTLTLSVNEFSGTIPAELAQMPMLHSIYLSYNNLTGPIPPEIFQTPNLAELTLSHNQITGTLPQTFGQAPFLDTFFCEECKLTGPLPTNFYNATALEEFNIANCSITDTLSTQFRNLNKLRTLLLNGNQFTGEVITEFDQIPKLNELALHDNSLTGAISQSICDKRGDGKFDLKVLTADCDKVTCDCCTICYPN